VLLGGAEEVVEEGHVELEDLDELDTPRLATLNSPSKLNARGSESEPYSAILR
jgi:hypothetical protein